MPHLVHADLRDLHDQVACPPPSTVRFRPITHMPDITDNSGTRRSPGCGARHDKFQTKRLVWKIERGVTQPGFVAGHSQEWRAYARHERVQLRASTCLILRGRIAKYPYRDLAHMDIVPYNGRTGRPGAAGVRSKDPFMPRRVRLRQLHGDREPAHCQGMMNFTDLASVPSHPLAPFTDRLRLAVAAYLARFKGTSRNAHRIRPALLPGLVRRARPGPAGRAAPAPGAVHPVDAGDPPVQALHRLPAVLGRGRVLPDLRPRRRAGAFARRARAPPFGARRITDPGIHAPAVRGPAHRRPGVGEPVRFRAGGHARPAGLADLRSHQRGHRRPRRGARPPGPARVRQGHQDRPGPAAARSRPGHRPGGRPPGSAGRSC